MAHLEKENCSSQLSLTLINMRNTHHPTGSHVTRAREALPATWNTVEQVSVLELSPQGTVCRRHTPSLLKEERCQRRLTLLTGFSRVFTDTSAGFPFLDGVLLILGEWNLSISFMVKEER